MELLLGRDAADGGNCCGAEAAGGGGGRAEAVGLAVAGGAHGGQHFVGARGQLVDIRWIPEGQASQHMTAAWAGAARAHAPPQLGDALARQAVGQVERHQVLPAVVLLVEYLDVPNLIDTRNSELGTDLLPELR